MPGVPRVAIMRASGMEGVAAIHLSPRLTGMALDRLAACGRRQVAVIARPEQVAGAQTALAERGLDAPSYWIHGVNPFTPEGARNIVHLMMSGPPDARPDGLIIMDDNLVEPATAGLVDAGVNVPEALTVVAHANFPYPTPSAVPAIRLGYDVRQVLAACMDNLIRQRQGGSVPDVTEIDVVGEAEAAEGSGL
jgi:DNA-binding LacI/PurR family transcriptional regulator